ncbi:MAG: hypothetical protein JJE34_01150 [Alphaproteobacteria bacterium]|nr:hypothetical protein [Alphaproteobacteria bacterium]
MIGDNILEILSFKIAKFLEPPYWQAQIYSVMRRLDIAHIEIDGLFVLYMA